MYRRVHIVALLLLLPVTLIGCGGLYNRAARFAGGEQDIFVAGTDSSLVPYALRLDSDGNPVPGFSLTVSGGPILEAVLMEGDTLLIGGSFTSINGVTRTGLAAVDAETGALGGSYNVTLANTGGPDVWAFAQEPDGVIVGGAWESVNGDTSRTNIARFWDDGALDTPFPYYTTNFVSCMLHAKGLNYVGGDFLQTGFIFGGVIDSERFFIFSPGDSLAEVIAPTTGEGPSAAPEDLSLLSDGRVLAVGPFDFPSTTPTQTGAVILKGREPDLSFTPAISRQFLTTTWGSAGLPGGGFVISGDILLGGDAVKEWIVAYGPDDLPMLTMPLTLDGSAETIVVVDSSAIYMGAGQGVGFTLASDDLGNSVSGSLIRVDSSFRIDTSFQPGLTGSVTTIVPLLY
jgi:hypothetical protein